jgi:hypothetical protein
MRSQAIFYTQKLADALTTPACEFSEEEDEKFLGYL